MISGVDYYRRQGFTGQPASQLLGPDSTDSGFNLMPGGWFYQNMVVMGEDFRDYLLPAVDASNHVVTPALGDEMEGDIELAS